MVLDKVTKQNPNFDFSQDIPGINDGRGIGIIESRELLRIADIATWYPDSFCGE